MKTYNRIEHDLAENLATFKKINLAISGLRFSKRLIKYSHYLANEKAILIELKMAAVLIERVISNIQYSTSDNQRNDDD